MTGAGASTTTGSGGSTTTAGTGGTATPPAPAGDSGGCNVSPVPARGLASVGACVGLAAIAFGARPTATGCVICHHHETS